MARKKKTDEAVCEFVKEAVEKVVVSVEHRMHPICPLNVRKGPSKESGVVRVLAVSDEVEVFKIEGEWGQIEDGWVMVEYLTNR